MIPAKPRTTTRPAAARTGARLKPAARLAPDKAAPAAPKGLADTPVVAPGPSAELADAMLDAMDEGVAVFDLDACPIYCNQRCIEITGLTLEDRLKMPTEQFVERMIREDGSPETVENLPSRIVLETGRSLSVTQGIYTPDGDLHWIEVNAAPTVSYTHLLLGRPPGHGHLPPGQSRVPGARRVHQGPWRFPAAAGLSGHARRHLSLIHI